MSLPVRDILKILADASVGTVGTNLFPGQLPDTPVNAVVVRFYGGSDPVRVFGRLTDAVVFRRQRFQVRVRNENQETAWDKAEAARVALESFDGAVTPTGGGTRTYHNIVAVGDLGELAESANLAYSVVGSYEATFEP